MKTEQPPGNVGKKKKKAQNKFGLLGRLARRNNIRDFFNTILK